MLRYFQTTLKSNPKPTKPSTLIPILSRIFPHKLKFLSHSPLTFASKSPTNMKKGRSRKFSTASGPIGPRTEVRADGEADLNHWVSGLSSKGSKKGVKNDGFGNGKSRGGDMELEDGRGVKRRKVAGLEEFKRSRRGGTDGRGRNERVSGDSRGAGRFGARGRTDMGRGGMRSNGGRGGIRSDQKVALSDEDEEETEGQNGFDSFKDLMASDEEEDEESEQEEEEKEDVDPINKETVMAWRQKEDAPPTSTSSGGSHLTQSRFNKFSVSSSTLKGLKDMGYETMTVVQEATLPVILKGKDVMAKARTGTGKTVAFLLPSIEVMEKTPPVSRDQMRKPILVLVICPTRELACQAAAEAEKLLKYHPSLGVQAVIGGTRLPLEQKRMQANPCQMLVATPGRLKDHIENTPGFRIRLKGIKVLVLDEADHLLDMGFRKDIERIIAAVPNQRQTLLFSATIPPEVKQMCHIALKRDYEYINTVQEGSEETHTQVRQTYLVATLDNHFPILYALLKEHIADNAEYKVLVFCTTAMVTQLIADLLAELNLNVREIHSRKPQSYRTRISDEFRKSMGLILVTSDVSARGVDYPDVTLVLQLGMASDKQQYIHRLGRTGRKGKEGQGILLLAPFEEYFLSTLQDLPITKAPTPSVDPEMKKKVQRSLSYVGTKEKESAYQAWVGYYNSSKIGKDKNILVQHANEFSRTMGLDKPPVIPIHILNKMGLRNIPGLRYK